MARRNVYHIRFILEGYWDVERGIDVLAQNKEDAYEKAMFVNIPIKFGRHPYSAWVKSVTYNNGNHREFNTDDGNAY